MPSALRAQPPWPLKVYVNNPALTGKVASVLQAGHVLSTRFQPYESHVPFLLQVWCDTSYGCACERDRMRWASASEVFNALKPHAPFVLVLALFCL